MADDRPRTVLVCGWGEQSFMRAMIRELDQGQVRALRAWVRAQRGAARRGSLLRPRWRFWWWHGPPQPWGSCVVTCALACVRGVRGAEGAAQGQRGGVCQQPRHAEQPGQGAPGM